MKQEQNIENVRHSLAHLLAAAVMELWPDTKRAIGPAIENGFYFDFEFSKPITEEDLPKIEKKMREIMPTWDKFEKQMLSAKDAKKEYPKNPYKHEMIDEFSENGKLEVSFYKSGHYWDLCAGGHVESMKNIDPNSFKLKRLAGAYWRGDEKNAMLTRIYGLAFATEKELKDYLKMIEEAEKRDHRKLGKELDLFVFSDLVGKGLPLLTPQGSVIRKELEKFVLEEETKRGYQHVITPPLAKVELYKTSGHYPYYKETMYPVMKVDEEELILRPMTCPHHFMLYKSRPRSYQELPIRFAEIASQFRY
jgi:threonyl-tRNA synthetase